MKVGIYNSCLENSSIGDFSAAVLAAALAQRDATEIIRISGASSRETFSLPGEQQAVLRTVVPPPQLVSDPNRPERRYEEIRRWSRELTRPYDLFINFTDRIPIFSSARQSVLVVQFPYDFIPSRYKSFWLDHLESYQLRLVNSYYTQFWTRAFWEIECPVVHPPVPQELAATSAPVAKENLIVSAQRFDATQPHRQLKLLCAFKMFKKDFPAWSLTISGDLDETRANQLFFTAVCEVARSVGVNVVANPSSAQEAELFRHSRIFWLASERDEEVDFHPEQSESFNLKLVQAMSAGCVPIVNNFGALSEVLRHGENGFFWTKPLELLGQTAALARNEAQLQAMAQTATKRALDFRSERFVNSFIGELEKTFGITTRARAINKLRRLFSPATRFLSGFREQQ